MDEKLLNKAKELSSNSYTVEVLVDKTTDGKTIYLAKNPELYGCMAQGSSIKDAISNLGDARIDYIYSLLKDGLDIPLPENRAAETASCATVTADSTKFKIEKHPIPFGQIMDNIIQPSQRERLFSASIDTSGNHHHDDYSEMNTH